MSVSVNPPKTPVTEGSSGIAAATMPNVCKMPGPPAPFVPTPLPNIGKSGSSPKDYSKDVEFEKKKVAIRGATFKSMGDIASKGTGGGIVSSNTEGPTRFVGPGSMDVKVEGKNVQLLSDPMLNNCGPSGSPPNSATMVGVVQNGSVIALVGDETCKLCNKKHGSGGVLEETDGTKGDATKLVDLARNTVRTQRTDFTMLGIVHCKDKQVYASNSGAPWWDLLEKTPKEWHRRIRPSEARSPVTTDDRKKRYKTYVIGQDKGTKFDKIWAKLDSTSTVFSNRRKQNKNTRLRAIYPPGSCAAQQGVLLCLDHGGHPTGLTERYYKQGDAEAQMRHYYREEVDGVLRLKWSWFGGNRAVPPCRSCEIILTALMCPEDKTKFECNHKQLDGCVGCTKTS